MPISPYIKETMTSKGAGVIRKMFEEVIKLKSIHGDENVFDFSLGNPSVEVPKEFTDEMIRLLQEEDTMRTLLPNGGNHIRSHRRYIPHRGQYH